MNSDPIALGLVLLVGAALGSYLSQVNGPFLDQIYLGISFPEKVSFAKDMAQTLYLSLLAAIIYVISAMFVLGKFKQVA